MRLELDWDSIFIIVSKIESGTSLKGSVQRVELSLTESENGERVFMKWIHF